MIGAKELKEWFDTIPNYSDFLTVEEIERNFRSLARTYPELTQLEEIGTSSDGRAISLLSIGRGDRNALFIAAPHPNEPIGCLTLDFLSRKMCEQPELVREWNCRFHFIGAADPDGLVLNEGWLKGGFTPLRYALSYYASSDEQVEWGFPIEYKGLTFLTPPAETRAIMEVMNRYRPTFLYSLHNGAFCGAYFYASHCLPILFDALAQLARSQGVPLDRGEPEAPWVTPWAAAIFPFFGAREVYDYMEEALGPNPTMPTGGGTTSSDWLGRLVPNRFSLAAELPYFTTPALSDGTSSGISRRDLMRTGVEAVAKTLDLMRSHLEVLRRLAPNTRLIRAVEYYVRRAPSQIEPVRAALGNDEFSRIATRAQAADTIVSSIFHPTLQLGMLRRVAESAGDSLRAAAIEEEIRNRIERLNTEYAFSVYPLRNLVAVQLGAGLLALTQSLEVPPSH